MKNMRNIVPFLIMILVFLSCTTEKSKVPADKKYGGSLRINMGYVPESVYPPAIHDALTSQVVSMFHSGLVKFHPSTLDVLPCIAQKWAVDTSNKVFTFYLRANAFFQNDACFSGGKGRQVTANDFVYTFGLLCTYDTLNNNFNAVSSIAGATEFYENGRAGKPKSTLKGVRAVNDSVFQITIEHPNPAFVNILANPAFSVIAKEAVEKYGRELLVGAGPFILKEKPVAGKLTILTRSDNYFLSDKKKLQLPYLDTVCISFNGSSQKELNLFFDGELDMIIGLTKTQMPKVVESRIKDFESKPPRYILSSATEKDVQLFNLLYPYVKDFYTNGMNYIDLSIVYFEKAPSDSVKIK